MMLPHNANVPLPNLPAGGDPSMNVGALYSGMAAGAGLAAAAGGPSFNLRGHQEAMHHAADLAQDVVKIAPAVQAVAEVA